MTNNVIQLHNTNEEVEVLKAQAHVYNHIFAYADSLVLRSAVELRIPDIIHAQARPMTLTQIASKIESRTIDISRLARVMRMLVRKKIFTVDYDESSQPLYGLTTVSKCLVRSQKLSLAPILLISTHQTLIKPWYEISGSITEGVTPFVKAHKESFYEMATNNAEFKKMFNTAMASGTKAMVDAIINGYKDGFSKMEGSLVDVGGGIGELITKIVEAYPHIKGINFDLPKAVENAPQHKGITHVGGDMFKEIPSAHNVIIKWVLHNWGDEECIRILKKCQKAISQKKGKVIIVDIVLHPDGHGLFDDATLAFDMLMLTECDGGKERTVGEWKILLKEAGFTHFNIIPLQTIMSSSILEAFSY